MPVRVKLGVSQAPKVCAFEVEFGTGVLSSTFWSSLNFNINCWAFGPATKTWPFGVKCNRGKFSIISKFGGSDTSIQVLGSGVSEGQIYGVLLVPPGSLLSPD